MKKLVSILVLWAVVMVAPLSAAEADATNWYFGAGYLQSEADTDIAGLTGTASLDEKDSGFKIFGGYQFNPYLGLEMAYADLGTVSLKGNNGDTFTYKGAAYSFTANNANLELDTWVIEVGGKFSLPLDLVTGQDYLKYITPFAKLGGFYWDQEATVTASGVNGGSISDDGFDFYFGAGLQINIHKNFAISGEWQRYTGDGSIDTYGANLIIRF